MVLMIDGNARCASVLSVAVGEVAANEEDHNGQWLQQLAALVGGCVDFSSMAAPAGGRQQAGGTA